MMEIFRMPPPPSRPGSPHAKPKKTTPSSKKEEAPKQCGKRKVRMGWVQGDAWGGWKGVHVARCRCVCVCLSLDPGDHKS